MKAEINFKVKAKVKVAVMTLILLLFSSLSVNAATYYVATNGSDSNPGTEVLPWMTLTKAANTVVAGDTVIVKAGKYIDPNGAWDTGTFNPANSGTASNPIIFKSQPQQAAILASKVKGVGPAISTSGRSYIIIDGFKAEGLIGIYNSDHVTVQNCEVIYGSILSTDTSLNWGIAIYSGSSYNIIRNNYVYNMLNSGNNLANTAGIMVHASSSGGSNYNIIENNLVDAGGGIVWSAYGQKGGNIANNIWRKNIAKNATTGFLGKGATDNTLFCDYNEYYNNIIYDTKNAFELEHNSRWFKIYNNTAYNCTQFLRSTYYPIEYNNIGEQVWNNIIANCTSGYYWPNSDTSTSNTPLAEVMALLSTANYNNFSNTPNIATWSWGNSSYKTIADWKTATGFDNNSFSVDPLFTDTTLKNFHLQGGSLLKGKGKNGEDIGAYATGNEQIGPDWQLTDGGGGGGGTPPPSSGSGGDSGGGSGGGGCGFVKDDNGKGPRAKGEGLSFAIMLIIALAGIALGKKVAIKRRMIIDLFYLLL